MYEIMKTTLKYQQKTAIILIITELLQILIGLIWKYQSPTLPLWFKIVHSLVFQVLLALSIWLAYDTRISLRELDENYKGSATKQPCDKGSQHTQEGSYNRQPTSSSLGIRPHPKEPRLTWQGALCSVIVGWMIFLMIEGFSSVVFGGSLRELVERIASLWG